MKLSSCEKILDEDKFLESHRLRILHKQSERMVLPFKNRLRKYAKLNCVTLCENCWSMSCIECEKQEK
jgi:hypothetical protein